jgi:hypothetical protein
VGHYVAGALEHHPQTVAALTAQLEGDPHHASEIYTHLLGSMVEDEDEDQGGVAGAGGGSGMGVGQARHQHARLWERENLRCLQRLGDWENVMDEVGQIVSSSATARATATAMAGPAPGLSWTVAGLRPSDDVDERAVAGSAVGGGVLGAAVRAMLRLDAENDGLRAIATDPAAAPGGGFISEELGVEMAAVKLLHGAEDLVTTHIAAVRRCFRLQWLGSHPCAGSVRRTLLQPLQPATELEEVLDVVRATRALHTGALGGACGQGGSRGGEESATGGRGEGGHRRGSGGGGCVDIGVAAVEKLLETWRRRWPSDALDPPEVWERVVAVRGVALEAFGTLAPVTVARSAVVIELLAREQAGTPFIVQGVGCRV